MSGKVLTLSGGILAIVHRYDTDEAQVIIFGLKAIKGTLINFVHLVIFTTAPGYPRRCCSLVFVQVDGDWTDDRGERPCLDF